MVAEAAYTDIFERAIRKIKDAAVKERIKNRVQDIIEKPEPDIGKPLKFEKKGERSIRIPPFRIIYSVQGDTLYFLDFDKGESIRRSEDASFPRQ